MKYKSDSPYAVLELFSPARLTLARELRGMTQKDLAELVRKTPSAISQIESGKLRPDVGTLAELALVLNVPVKFFALRDWSENNIRLDSCHFRSKNKASQRLRLKAVRDGDVLLWVADRFEEWGVVFPSENISNYQCSSSFEDLDNIAEGLRKHWGLGIGPIPDVTLLFESNGIFVIPIEQNHKDLDAFSVWRAGRPMVFLSTNNKTAARARFNLGHELGHLILHDGVVTGCRNTERQANYFSGAFLAPKDSFGIETPRRWDFDGFYKLSIRWKIAVEAALVRAYQLGRISKFSYENGLKELRARQKKIYYGDEWPHEKPVLLSKAIQLILGRHNFCELLESIGMHRGEIEKRLGLLVDDEVLIRFVDSVEANDEAAGPRLSIISSVKNTYSGS